MCKNSPRIIVGQIDSPGLVTNFRAICTDPVTLQTELGVYLFGPAGSEVEGVDLAGNRGLRMRPGLFDLPDGSSVEVPPVVPYEALSAAEHLATGGRIEVRLAAEEAWEVKISSVVPEARGEIAALIIFRAGEESVSITRSSTDALADFLADLVLRPEASEAVGPAHSATIAGMILAMVGDFRESGDAHAKFECEQVDDSGVGLCVYLVRA